MTYHRKTWQEKIEDRAGYPKVLKLHEGFPCFRTLHRMGVNAGDDVVLVNPSDVLRLMKLVLKGKVTTLSEICQKLAGQY
jgi:predicted nucleotide-binding protein (sugar kinase/HSP70/actin superfamily)